MRMVRWALMVVVLAGLAACQTVGTASAPAATNVKLPSFFSDNMVVQREQPVPVWGTADAGGRVEVSVAGKRAFAVAGPDGKWTATLKPMKAGGPFEMTVAGRETIAFKNVLVGEVWIASGQSNMQMPVKVDNYGVDNGEQEIKDAHYPNIRLITVPNVTSPTPQDTVFTDGWKVCSPETVPWFSAAAYFFGRKIHEDLNVPVGLIHTSWGGTLCEAWTSREALMTMPEFKAAIEESEKNKVDLSDLQKQYDAENAEWEKTLDAKDAGLSAGTAVWAAPGVKTDDWAAMTLPSFWESADLTRFDGTVWFRKEVTVPAAMAGKDATLHLGAINDSERVWVNGEEIRLPAPPKVWSEHRAYAVPGRMLREGVNAIVVRVYDMGGQGGIAGEEADLRLEVPGADVLPLAGEWKYKIGINVKDAGPRPKRPAQLAAPQNMPSALYNAMINPLIPYGMRGAIWYQGESNAGRAYQYRTLFPLMIKDWRQRWGQGDFPFLFVELASFNADNKVATEPEDNTWAELREAQLIALSLPNTGVASAVDIGISDNIHPTNKQEVGRRLALAAEHVAYGRKLVYSGPMYKGMKVEGGAIRLSFHHVGGGLVAKDGGLKGFAMAGADKKFVWADATIEGDSVVVSSPQVAAPVAVRYAWTDDPVMTLFNAEGLPASPFRTDDWAGITQGK
ncbi:MAG: sialate O-acetylesterase [FCB group bacterium]|nr:sialate O-acetylesterase [FCB group bacterium]